VLALARPLIQPDPNHAQNQKRRQGIYPRRSRCCRASSKPGGLAAKVGSPRQHNPEQFHWNLDILQFAGGSFTRDASSAWRICRSTSIEMQIPPGQPRARSASNVYAVPVHILLPMHDVADMDANANLNLPFRRTVGIAFRQGSLNLDRALRGFQCTPNSTRKASPIVLISVPLKRGKSVRSSRRCASSSSKASVSFTLD